MKAWARSAALLLLAMLSASLFATAQSRDLAGYSETAAPSPTVQVTSEVEDQQPSQNVSKIATDRSDSAKTSSTDDQNPTTPPAVSQPSKWPEPVADSAPYTYTLFDLLEYQRLRGDISAFRWSILGWRGGDAQRFWFKSEGEQYSSSRIGGEADVQALYGKAISPYFDLQAGLRYEEHFEVKNAGRVFAVLALQGLAPYRLDFEPELFLSNKGKFSARVTASTDLLITQRLILQPRLETNLSFQRDRSFGVDPGFNDAEVGLRARYEIRREFAPYVGISFRQDYGATAARTVREGGISNQLQFVFGIRLWH